MPAAPPPLFTSRVVRTGRDATVLAYGPTVKTALKAAEALDVAALNPRYMTQITQTSQEHVDQIDRYYLPLIDDALNGAPYITYDSDFHSPPNSSSTSSSWTTRSSSRILFPNPWRTL